MRFPSLVLLALLLGCAGNKETAMLEKADASLRQSVEQASARGGSEVLHVLGGCTGTVTEERKGALAAAGAVLESTSGDTFTARIPAGRVAEVAALEFVRSLELSKTRESLTR